MDRLKPIGSDRGDLDAAMNGKSASGGCRPDTEAAFLGDGAGGKDFGEPFRFSSEPLRTVTFHRNPTTIDIQHAVLPF
ncbi:hypothetical protein [Paracoccus laeviglucosivorans]|uniref:hypothetical protein n=1 Tax=Paracoccus laeviglucosivorans TaxID=1197861 RepID=UPI0011595239|nr:hypothetical protein [Paracoccus laeviglucosivorans]